MAYVFTHDSCYSHSTAKLPSVESMSVNLFTYITHCSILRSMMELPLMYSYDSLLKCSVVILVVVK